MRKTNPFQILQSLPNPSIPSKPLPNPFQILQFLPNSSIMQKIGFRWDTRHQQSLPGLLPLCSTMPRRAKPSAFCWSQNLSRYEKGTSSRAAPTSCRDTAPKARVPQEGAPGLQRKFFAPFFLQLILTNYQRPKPVWRPLNIIFKRPV